MRLFTNDLTQSFSSRGGRTPGFEALYRPREQQDCSSFARLLRQHEPQRIVGDLLTAEVNEKQALRSDISSPLPRGRFYNVIDLVNRLEIETRNGRATVTSRFSRSKGG
jgi:hypothetical protein